MVTVLEDSFRKSLSQHLHSHYFQMISILCKVLRSDSMLWSVLCCCLVTKSCLTLLQPHGLSPTTLLCPWNFPGKNIGVSCHFLLHGIFPTQGLNLCLLNCQTDSLLSSCLGSPVLFINTNYCS